LDDGCRTHRTVGLNLSFIDDEELGQECTDEVEGEEFNSISMSFILFNKAL